MNNKYSPTSALKHEYADILKTQKHAFRQSDNQRGTNMKKAFRYLPVVTAIISLPAMAHVGYTGRNFGTFDRTYSTARLSDQAVTGNYGWIDGTDSDNGDSHKLRPYRFTLAEETN